MRIVRPQVIKPSVAHAQGRDAQLLGQSGLGLEMTGLAMHWNEILRARETIELAKLAPAGMAGSMNRAECAFGNQLDAAVCKLVLDADHSIFIARYGPG